MLTSYGKHNSKRLCRKCPLPLLVVTLVLLVGAAQGSCHGSTPNASPNASSLTPNASLNTSSPLSTLHTPHSQYSAYLTRYWDGVDPDTLSDEVREQRLVDYIYLTINADSALRRQCWQTLAKVFDRQQPNHTVVDYLGEPDSPLYAPAMLDEYLVTIAALFDHGTAQRQRVEYLLAQTRKNRPGQTIADLSLIDATTARPTTLHRAISILTSSPNASSCGRSQKDYCYLDMPGASAPASQASTAARAANDRPSSSPSVQVLFYDPDCDECAALIDRLAASPTPVIAISVTGTASEALPTTWLSFIAADADQLDENFYLPSLPRLYTVTPTAQIR